MRALFLFIYLSLAFNSAYAQKFWLTTYSFPGGYKNGIEKINDSLILVSTENSLLASTDKGVNWDVKLNASKINCIYHAKNNRIFLGGAGKVFYSDNLLNWDSLVLPTGYQILQFVENNSAIYLISGGFNTVQGYVGDGIYKSNNNGITWERKNNGLGSILSSQFIKVDKYDRLIAAFADNNISNQSGIYISSDNADTWQRIIVKVDGKGAISSEALRIEDFTNLSITDEDSVVISFDGTANNVGVRLNLTKHIDDLLLNNFWTKITVFNSNMWWMDRSMGPLHISQKGDWYSSLQGTFNTGGSLYSNTKGSTWLRHQYGLGIDFSGSFNTQKFIEMGNGRIYMIQYGDERVYFTDTSQFNNVDNNYQSTISFYPNPIFNDQLLNIEFNSTQTKDIKIYNLDAQLIDEIQSNENIVRYKFNSKGVYIIYVNEAGRIYYNKVIVN